MNISCKNARIETVKIICVTKNFGRRVRFFRSLPVHLYHTINLLTYTSKLVQYEIYFSRHFIFYYFHSCYALVKIMTKNKMTRKINLILHSEAYVNIYICHMSLSYVSCRIVLVSGSLTVWLSGFLARETVRLSDYLAVLLSRYLDAQLLGFLAV